MGQTWNKLLNAIRGTSEDDDSELDKKIGREVRNLFKDKKLDDLQDYLDYIQKDLEDKDKLIQLLLEEREELKKDSPVIVGEQEKAEAIAATSKDESQSTN